MTSIKKSSNSSALQALNNRRRLTLEEMQAIARERGGLCLSDSYLNIDAPLQWQCAQLHRWHARPNSVKRGTWCAICYRESQRQNLEELQDLARQHGGELLSKRPGPYLNKLRWRCAHNHTWQATASQIRVGHWCLQCYHDSMRGNIEAMQALATAKGGSCLSRTYIDAATHLQWQCAVGHVWEAMPSTVTTSWCPMCSFDRKRLGIEKMREVARQRGGHCLSETYKSVATCLTWQCAEGHTWQAKPIHVQRGHWCHECFLQKVRAGISEMQEIAKMHGGLCLSDTYINRKSPLSWQCIEGHIWEARSENIIRGSWCPECRRIGRDLKKKLDAKKKKERFSMPNLL